MNDLIFLIYALSCGIQFQRAFLRYGLHTILVLLILGCNEKVADQKHQKQAICWLKTTFFSFVFNAVTLCCPFLFF